MCNKCGDGWDDYGLRCISCHAVGIAVVRKDRWFQRGQVTLCPDCAAIAVQRALIKPKDVWTVTELFTR